MKVSELIQRLRLLRAKYGDLPVTSTDSGWGHGEVNDVKVWTENGNTPDMRKRRTDPPVEIQLY